MKLASHAELKRLTGQESPESQYNVLTRELGIRPIFIDGKVRVYEEVLVGAMLNATPKKPKLDI